MTSQTGPLDARAASESRVNLPHLVSAAFKVIAPTAVITALLYYFGWARTDAAAQMAGLDQSLFGFSTSDYMLRSVSPLLKPFGLGLLAVAVVAITAGATRQVVRGKMTQGSLPPRRLDRIGWTLLTLSFAAVTAGALLLPSIRTQAPAHSAALLILVGAGSLWAALSLADLHRDLSSHGEGLWLPPAPGDESPELRRVWLSDVLSPQRSWVLGVVGALVLVGLFAFVLRLAFEDGKASIADYARTLDQQPTVTITSPTPLDIHLRGVKSTFIDASADQEVGPRFRYTGMHLLLEANDRLFLVTPDFGASGRVGPVAVVPHTDDLRLDFAVESP